MVSKKLFPIIIFIYFFQYVRDHPLMMSDFWGGWGGGLAKLDKIGQNRTRGVGSLAKIGHPIILVFSQKQFQNSKSDIIK